MRIPKRHFNICMPQNLLQRQDAPAAHNKMRRERMAANMRKLTGGQDDSGAFHRMLKGFRTISEYPFICTLADNMAFKGRKEGWV